MGKTNRYFVLCLILVFSLEGYAQEEQADFFYSGASVKREIMRCGNSVMVCDTLDNAMICIYNHNNQYWGKDQHFTDNTQFTKEMLLGNTNFILDTPGQRRHMKTIVDNAFSEEMVTQLNGALFMVTVHINSSDGTVAGVGFTFDKGDEYENIHIGVYKEIEDEIKNNLVFELTPLAQKLNFNQLFWLQCPKGIAEESATETEEGADGGTTSSNNNSLQTDLGGAVTDRGTTSSGGLATPIIGGLVTP
ncbi:MAG: DUF5043 domain-containing protein [Tidjanibacter sp.]|nr:DUF5043 domain-containing protein [Tidjanibacter sp.]